MATDNKYDRQLRLWGSNGQKALSESCVVLINATAVGTETLKNLVLPGIGSFHIIDDHLLGKPCSDTSTGDNSTGGENVKPFSNFFAFHDGDSSNRARAEIATEHLSELNPDVKGSCTPVASLETADYAAIFKSIAEESSSVLVIASDLPPHILKTISSICWDGIGLTPRALDSSTTSTVTSPSQSQSPIPLLIVRSYGLLGSVRVQTTYHPIIESKPDNTKPDLRLAFAQQHFPQLYDLAIGTDLKSLDSQQHSHVPFVILLLQAMARWRGLEKEKESDSVRTGTDDKDEHKNDTSKRLLPKTFLEKNEFKKLVKSMSRNWGHELNFIEAEESAYLAYTMQEIPWEVEDLLQSIEDVFQTKAKTISSFDVLLLCLKRFMETHDGYPPLDGSIPDMTASTNRYIELQGIYKTKAESDKAEMKNILASIVEEFGGSDGSFTIPDISNEELTIFCKNVYNLRLIKTRSFLDEYEFKYQNDEEKGEILGELASLTYDPYEVPEHTPLLWMIALRACDAFYDDNGHYPGNDSRELALESDVRAVQKHIVSLLVKLGLEENELIQSTLLSVEEDKKDAFAKEVVRYHNAEIHNVASVVGGVASQEAVKLITGQYVPMDGTYLFNGIAGVAGICTF